MLSRTASRVAVTDQYAFEFHAQAYAPSRDYDGRFGHFDFRKHFYVTTSGNFDTPALVNAMAVMGTERVMFSIDWPFEDVGEGAQWFDKAEISEADRVKIGRANAIELFRLPLR